MAHPTKPNPNCTNCDGYGSGLFTADGPCGACWPKTPGRAIDEQVGERIFLFRIETVGPDYYGEHAGDEVLWPPDCAYRDLMDHLPRKGKVPRGYWCKSWSTERLKAEEVKEHMRQRGFVASARHTPDGRTWWEFAHQDGRKGRAEGTHAEEPAIICLAALAAVDDAPH